MSNVHIYIYRYSISMCIFLVLFNSIQKNIKNPTCTAGQISKQSKPNQFLMSFSWDAPPFEHLKASTRLDIHEETLPCLGSCKEWIHPTNSQVVADVLEMIGAAWGACTRLVQLTTNRLAQNEIIRNLSRHVVVLVVLNHIQTSPACLRTDHRTVSFRCAPNAAIWRGGPPKRRMHRRPFMSFNGKSCAPICLKLPHQRSCKAFPAPIWNQIFKHVHKKGLVFMSWVSLHAAASK